MLMGDEDRCLRVRRTFIDFGRDLPCPNRSHSSPPSTLPKVTIDSERIATWVESANFSSFHRIDDKGVSAVHSNVSRQARKSYNSGVNDKDLVCNSSCFAHTDELEDEIKMCAVGMMRHSPQANDRRAVTQGDKNTVAARLSWADLSLPWECSSEDGSTATEVTWPATSTPIQCQSGETSDADLSWDCSSEDDSIATATTGPAENIPLQCQSGETPDTIEVTTLMINFKHKNGHLEKERFMDVMHEQGFSNNCDMIYMPMSKSLHPKSLGYLFVNFKKQETAEAFTQLFDNLSLPFSKKPCAIRRAHCQGLEANMEMHVSNKSTGWLCTVGHNGLMEWTWM
jgi:hypothetical protein